MDKLLTSEITPEHLFRSRRQFIRGSGALLAGALTLAACGPSSPAATVPATPGTGQGQPASPTDELGDALTPYDAVTGYNNYYEFTTSKEGVAPLSQNFHTTPWAVAVGGLVGKPKTYAIEDLL